MAAGVGGACAIHDRDKFSSRAVSFVEIEGKGDGKTSEGTRKVPNS